MRLPFEGEYLITQGFGNVYIKTVNGVKIDVYAQWNLKGHDGKDYALPKLTPVLAPHSGKVIEANYDPTGYGNYVKLENDIEGSVLAHLTSISVAPGFLLKEGDLIGLSGDSGSAEGAPHLHWGYYRFPRDRKNGYDGFIDQTVFLPNYSTYNFKYKVGDEIRPQAEIPVGASPGKEQFDYGKIGPNTPAKILNVQVINNTGYYNIDQRYIGGGTGWVNAKTIDNTIQYVASPPITVTSPSPVSTSDKMYSETEFLEIQKQRDIALADKEEIRKQYNDVNAKYSAMVAVGFSTPDDITSLLTKTDETINGLNKQLLQVLERNKILAELVQKKEDEDSTAIDEGMRAQQELKVIKNDIKQISAKVGTKANVFDIITQINEIKQLAQKAVRFMQKESNAKNEIVGKETQKAVKYGVDWLISFLGLYKKEVK